MDEPVPEVDALQSGKNAYPVSSVSLPPSVPVTALICSACFYLQREASRSSCRANCASRYYRHAFAVVLRARHHEMNRRTCLFCARRQIYHQRLLIHHGKHAADNNTWLSRHQRCMMAGTYPPAHAFRSSILRAVAAFPFSGGAYSRTSKDKTQSTFSGASTCLDSWLFSPHNF